VNRIAIIYNNRIKI